LLGGDAVEDVGHLAHQPVIARIEANAKVTRLQRAKAGEQSPDLRVATISVSAIAAVATVSAGARSRARWTRCYLSLFGAERCDRSSWPTALPAGRIVVFSIAAPVGRTLLLLWNFGSLTDAHGQHLLRKREKGHRQRRWLQSVQSQPQAG